MSKNNYRLTGYHLVWIPADNFTGKLYWLNNSFSHQNTGKPVSASLLAVIKYCYPEAKSYETSY